MGKRGPGEGGRGDYSPVLPFSYSPILLQIFIHKSTKPFKDIIN